MIWICLDFHNSEICTLVYDQDVGQGTFSSGTLITHSLIFKWKSIPAQCKAIKVLVWAKNQIDISHNKAQALAQGQGQDKQL